MASTATIVTGIKTALATLSDVDQSSIDSFLPAVTTAKAALIMAPFGQRESFSFADLGAATVRGVQRIPAQVWVKHINGKEADTATRARGIGLAAAKALMAADGDSYTLDTDEPITVETEEFMVEVGNAAYLVVRLSIPVLNDEPVS